MKSDSTEFLNNLLQNRYVFNDSLLIGKDLSEIKLEADKIRVSFGATAPIGVNIFPMMELRGDIVFILKAFSNPELDAMIIRYRKNVQKKYIILNSQKPLINQIFAAAHEYYHYLFSFNNQDKQSIICSFNKTDMEEVKANRFAAELLLPSKALKNEIELFVKYTNSSDLGSLKINELALFLFRLTKLYSLPLKAVMYRLKEEKLYEDIDFLMANYDILKKVFVEIFKDDEIVKELLSAKNQYISSPVNNLLPFLYEKGRIDASDLEYFGKLFKIDDGKIQQVIDDDKKGTLEDPNLQIDFGKM